MRECTLSRADSDCGLWSRVFRFLKMSSAMVANLVLVCPLKWPILAGVITMMVQIMHRCSVYLIQRRQCEGTGTFWDSLHTASTSANPNGQNRKISGASLSWHILSASV